MIRCSYRVHHNMRSRMRCPDHNKVRRRGRSRSWRSICHRTVPHQLGSRGWRLRCTSRLLRSRCFRRRLPVGNTFRRWDRCRYRPRCSNSSFRRHTEFFRDCNTVRWKNSNKSLLLRSRRLRHSSPGSMARRLRCTQVRKRHTQWRIRPQRQLRTRHRK